MQGLHIYLEKCSYNNTQYCLFASNRNVLLQRPKQRRQGRMPYHCLRGFLPCARRWPGDSRPTSSSCWRLSRRWASRRWWASRCATTTFRAAPRQLAAPPPLISLPLWWAGASCGVSPMLPMRSLIRSTPAPWAIPSHSLHLSAYYPCACQPSWWRSKHPLFHFLFPLPRLAASVIIRVFPRT